MPGGGGTTWRRRHAAADQVFRVRSAGTGLGAARLLRQHLTAERRALDAKESLIELVADGTVVSDKVK